MALSGGHAASERPQDWQYASPDLNVLLTGRQLNDDGTTVEFELADGGLYIEHAALVSVTCSPTSQVLASLNTGKPILTLSTPLIPEQSVEDDTEDERDGNDEQPSASSSSTTRSRKPTIVTLHHPLLTLQQAQARQQSPLYSVTFKILVDGSDFLPPRFDPTNLAPPTPNVTGSAHILNSPTVQRALLSPLLSPQRRAASQGSDASVPPLNLGVSRARAPSITGPSLQQQQHQQQPASSTSALAHTNAPSSSSPSMQPHSFGARRGSFVNGQQQQQNLLSAGASTRPSSLQDDLTKYVEPNGRPSLDQVMTADVSSKAKATAEDILNLRRQHDSFVKRAKAELEVLSARVTNAANAVSTTIVPGSGLVVRGFGTTATATASASPSKSRSPADRRSATTTTTTASSSRERSIGRGDSEERGRSTGASRGQRGAATPTTRNSDMDEQKSQEIRDEDERQEEERGRSRSRVRRSQDGGGGGSDNKESRQQKSTSKSRDKVAEVVAAVAASSTGASSPSRQPGSSGQSTATSSRSAAQAGDTIPASVDDSEPMTNRGYDQSNPAPQPKGDRVATPVFVPSSHALVAIPETEELSLPPSEAGGDRSPDPRQSPRARAQTTPGSDEDSDHDAPFEMDEDIDVDEIELDEPVTDLDEHVPETEATTQQQQQQQQGQDASSAYRVGSLRPTSTLSSSYAALLSSSSAARHPPVASSYRPPSMASFKPSPMFPVNHGSSKFSTAASAGHSASSLLESAQATVTATSTSAREDARVEMDYVPSPDPKLAREGQSKIRQVLAMDAPSHRAPLPSRRRRASHRPSDDESDDQDQEDAATKVATSFASRQAAPAHAVVGSLPISIGFARPTSTFRPPTERELERKTSVPSREGMFVVPLLRQEARRRSQQQQQQQPALASSGIAIDTSPSPSRARQSSLSEGGGPGGQSSLAQSLRQHPSNVRSFGQVLREEEEEEADESVRRGLREETAAATTTTSPLRDDGADDGADDDDDDEEEFVPPHLLLKNARRKDEQFLSRSVQSDE
ncbi:hypothetical protein ACM66B_005529 [Microbotryomycetes sp. NB124-2]